jgi:hypothetical protein
MSRVRGVGEVASGINGRRPSFAEAPGVRMELPGLSLLVCLDSCHIGVSIAYGAEVTSQTGYWSVCLFGKGPSHRFKTCFLASLAPLSRVPTVIASSALTIRETCAFQVLGGRFFATGKRNWK